MLCHVNSSYIKTFIRLLYSSVRTIYRRILMRRIHLPIPFHSVSPLLLLLLFLFYSLASWPLVSSDAKSRNAERARQRREERERRARCVTLTRGKMPYTREYSDEKKRIIVKERERARGGRRKVRNGFGAGMCLCTHDLRHVRYCRKSKLSPDIDVLV